MFESLSARQIPNQLFWLKIPSAKVHPSPINASLVPEPILHRQLRYHS